MSTSEMSLAASRVDMVSLQRLPMLPTRQGMEVDSARSFSFREGLYARSLSALSAAFSPSSRALFVHGCHVNWSHVRVRRTISSCDLGGGRLHKRELFACTADKLCKLESTFFCHVSGA
jgi:hypothetical protein